MQRISSRPEELAASYEIVIIGSGYGGSIMASRLARAGRDVCLLERGAERLPGEYPDSVMEAADEWQMTTGGGHHYGNRQALYQFNIGDDINVFKGCGLGGTSQVNAGVAIEPDPRVFDDPRWPAPLRADLDGLRAGFDRARHMLGSTAYPQERSPLAKTTLLQRSAAALNEPFLLPTINVTFDDRVNAAGVEQPACNGCGDCVSGCNTGAKNTLIMNYLPDAQRWGAKIFTGVDVRWVERCANGKWNVQYQVLGAGRGRFGEAPLTLEADIVVLAAGTLGSTELLLRSREHGLTTSARLGQSFSGNGDVLGFAFDCDEPAHGIGWGHEVHTRGPLVGPCITGVIDERADRPLDDGIIIEEGSIPGALAHLIAPAFAAAPEEPLEEQHRLRRIKMAAEAILEGSYHGPINRTQTFLVMGHDDGAGTMALENDQLRIHWPGVGGQPLFKRVDTELRKASEAVGGTYIPNPLWHEMLRQPLITVHPLGGCPMGDTAATGAVDHMGRVFTGEAGDTVHDGLIVCDAAIIPRPLGVNPLLTISALAERNAAQLAATRGWTISYAAAPAHDAPHPADALLLEFTEKIKGYVGVGATEPAAGFAQGMADKTECWYEISMAGDARAIARDPSTTAAITGLVGCPAISPDNLTIEGGEFQLFVPQNGDPADTKMLYRLPLRATDGSRWFLDGYKQVREGEPWQLWHDTTTLYVTIHHDDVNGPIWGAGVLRIAAHDFAKQLTTMRVSGAAPLTHRLAALASYGKMFAGHLFEYYAGPVGWKHLHAAEPKATK
ncbi:MAG TPA: GMC family oxidoreductase [Acidimicrobiales bacterium]|nr:GMC family oxidoreductase [Acidimicrobiales bacterium]